MTQRGPMPPNMRAFVVFMAVAFVSVGALQIARAAHVLGGRTWMVCFFAAGAIAGLASWVAYRKPAG
jgi:hypothetical protein